MNKEATAIQCVLPLLTSRDEVGWGGAQNKGQAAQGVKGLQAVLMARTNDLCNLCPSSHFIKRKQELLPVPSTSPKNHLVENTNSRLLYMKYVSQLGI